MTKIVDIRPDVSAERVIDPPYLEARMDQLMREADILGAPVVLVTFYDEKPYILANHMALDHSHLMCGVFEDAKDFLRGIIPMEEVPESNEEGKPI